MTSSASNDEALCTCVRARVRAMHARNACLRAVRWCGAVPVRCVPGCTHVTHTRRVGLLVCGAWLLAVHACDAPMPAPVPDARAVPCGTQDST